MGYTIEQIGENTFLISGTKQEELISQMNQKFKKFTQDELIPIIEGNKTLKELYLPDEDGKVKEIFPVVGFYEGVTERYFVKVDQNSLKDHPSELKRITEAIQNSEFGNPTK